MSKPPRALAGLAPLMEPTRLSLYRHLQERAPEAVGRDEAAAALGISRPLAAFHLDRLVAAGLVESTFKRLNDRSGPGAGRPSKLYRPATPELSYSLPARRYDLAGLLLARALRGFGREGIKKLRAEARRYGRSVGQRGGWPELRALLAQEGYSPVDTGKNELALRTCPFDALATESIQPVCAMNLALIEGLVESTGADCRARLAPAPGWCCVRLRNQSGGTM